LARTDANAASRFNYPRSRTFADIAEKARSLITVGLWAAPLLHYCVTLRGDFGHKHDDQFDD